MLSKSTIEVKVKSLLPLEAYEELEEKLRSFFQDEGIEVEMENSATGNSVVVDLVDEREELMAEALNDFNYENERGVK